MALSLQLLSNVGLADEKTHTYVGGEAKTKRVNSSGSGYSKSRTDCISAPTGRLFSQSSFKTKTKSKRNALIASCSLSFENYKEIVPGISQPGKACLETYVKVEGGLSNYGENAKHKCKMSYQLQMEDIGIAPAPSAPSGRDALAVVPLLPADIRMRREKESTISFGVPLTILNGKLEPMVTNGASLKDIRFTNYKEDSLTLTLQARASILDEVKCSPKIRLGMPASKFSDFGVQVLEVSPSCRAGGFLSNAANAPAEISKIILKEANISFVNKVFAGSDFDDWAEDDPELFKFLDKAWMQGRYCQWRGDPGLCLQISWSDNSAIEKRESRLLASVPKPEGSTNIDSARQRLEKLYEFAKEHQVYQEDGLEFPVGFRKGDIEDADMALFGGLLCRAGIDEGCKLVKDAQHSSGQFFRSPRRLGNDDTSSKATFSGDQLKGVIHYLTATADRHSLLRFLEYLGTQETRVIATGRTLESGYSSCPNRAPNFTCLLIGADWYMLERLAKLQGLDWALPSDIGDIKRRYDFDVSDLVWEALVTNNGYRLHLVANIAWSMKSLGIVDPSLEKTLRIILAREPENPFFNYLVLGSDARVQRLADLKCNADLERDKRYDWAWQRAERDEAWNDGMVWDCVFIYKLLIDDPLPVTTKTENINRAFSEL